MGTKASPDIVELFETHGIIQTYPKNTALFKHGEAVEYYYYTLSGAAHYSVSFKQGRETSTALLLPGRVIAPSGPVASGSVFTLSECKLIRMSAKELLDIVYSDSELAKSYEAHLMNEHNGSLMGAVLNAQLDAGERVALFFQMLAMEANIEVKKGYYTIGYKFSHEFICHFVNANRVTVSKTLSAWQKDGSIIIQNGIIAISEDMFRAVLYR